MNNNNSLSCSKEMLESLISQASNGDSVDMLKLQELLNNKVKEDMQANEFLGVARAVKSEPIGVVRNERTAALTERYCNPDNDFHNHNKVRADSKLGMQTLATTGPGINNPTDAVDRDIFIECTLGGDVGTGLNGVQATMNTPCSAQNLENMDVFCKSMGKIRPIVNREPQELLNTIYKLSELGIRENDYAEVKLGTLSYKDYLYSRPELLNFKRFKSILKKAVGYSGVGHNLTKEQKILTIESMFSLADGSNKDFNEWIDNVSEFLYKQKKLRFRIRFGEDYSESVKYFDAKNYLSTAIEYLFGYAEEHYVDTMNKMYLETKAHSILFVTLAGLIELGYDVPHILYAILRPVLPKRGYKDFTVSSYVHNLEYGNAKYISTLKSVLAQGITKLSVKEQGDIVTTFSGLLEILNNNKSEEYDKVWETYECLMINNVVPLKKRLRKHRLFFEANSLCRKLSCTERHMGKFEVSEQTTEAEAWDYKRLTKIIEELKTAYSFDDKTVESLHQYIMDENYNAILECIASQAYSGKMYDKELHTEIAEENCKLPFRRSRVLEYLTDKETDDRNMEVSQICSEFKYGEPRY